MCEKTPAELHDFVLDGWDFDRENFKSDYDSYDQSQGGAFLNFELRKAAHFSVPLAVRQFYAWVKTHAEVFCGILAIMRLSGEGPTFDANTECNIAYDALKHELTPNVKACYGGDDLARDKNALVRPFWRKLEPLFTLKSKAEVLHQPDFCGWLLTRHGVVKEPEQLYQSLQLGLRLGKLDEIVPSYSLDFSYAYRLGDKLHDIFNERQMAFHSATVRLMHKLGVHAKVAGDHLPVYHVRSDKLLTRNRAAAPPKLDTRCATTTRRIASMAVL